MSAETDLARAALRRAQADWGRHFTLLGGVALALTIDWVTGRQFWNSDATVKALGFALPRTAFSITYMLVFIALALRHLGTARLVRSLCEELPTGEERAAVAGSAEVRLWLLSPLNSDPRMRAAFWGLAGLSLALLASVSWEHLTLGHAPPPGDMPPEQYWRIGLWCALTLTVSSVLALTRLYPDWKHTRDVLFTRMTPAAKPDPGP